MNVVVVLPAFNAARTLEATIAEIPAEYRDGMLLVDDGSTDDTVGRARDLGLQVVTHTHNRGYGANQKTCYQEALRRGADVAVMVHPDHQYDATAIHDLLSPLLTSDADVVLGSRMLLGDPRSTGMPGWRYRGNRLLTACQNRVFGLDLTDYHTGFRGFTAQFLQAVRFLDNADDFLFDQQILAQAVTGGFRVVEVGVRCRYGPESSSISFAKAVRYGLGTLQLLGRHKWHQSSPGSAGL